MTEIFEIPNFEPDIPNGEGQEDTIDVSPVCPDCQGMGGWDEDMIDEESGEEFEAWVVCDTCDGEGFLE